MRASAMHVCGHDLPALSSLLLRHAADFPATTASSSIPASSSARYATQPALSATTCIPCRIVPVARISKQWRAEHGRML